jgi:hypothetical protein
MQMEMWQIFLKPIKKCPAWLNTDHTINTLSYNVLPNARKLHFRMVDIPMYETSRKVIFKRNVMGIFVGEILRMFL